MVDEGTKRQLSQIPLLNTKASPRDKDLWVQRLKEELLALIKYVQNNKASDSDWFKLDSNKEGTKWFGTVRIKSWIHKLFLSLCFLQCWYVHDLLKYEFAVEFDVINNPYFLQVCTIMNMYFFILDPGDLSSNCSRNCFTRGIHLKRSFQLFCL